MKKLERFYLLILFVLVGCNKPTEPIPVPRPALVMIVEEKASAYGLALVGEVVPRYESRQAFRINGKIIERKVDVGALVKKGQPIAKLDATDTGLEVAAAMADIREAEANFALASAEVERYRQLISKKFISASALDSREAELKTSNARLAQAKAQAKVTVNKSQYTNLTADRDGVVTLVHAEPGQVVQAGEVVVQIAGTKEIEVLVAIPESRISEVKINAPVSVRMWADRIKKYEGVVREIAATADSSTRAFNVRVTIQNTDDAVKLGMTAGVKFSHVELQPRPGFLIPTTALTKINGKSIVWVIEADNKAQVREVKAGNFTEEGVFITEGLQVGEKIAVAGVHTLVENQLVKPITGVTP